MQYSIPDKRELTPIEIQFLVYLFRTVKPEWLNEISKLKVIARCGCGTCPTILLGKSFDAKVEMGHLLMDFAGKDQNGNLIGVSVFANGLYPTQLEFHSVDGLAETVSYPEINTLESLNS